MDLRVNVFITAKCGDIILFIGKNSCADDWVIKWLQIFPPSGSTNAKILYVPLRRYIQNPLSGHRREG